MVAEGDRVATRSTWTGTHRGAFFGVPATGRRVAVEAWTMDYFRDGKLAESRIIMDVMGLMQQLGAIPEPADSKAATPGRRTDDRPGAGPGSSAPRGERSTEPVVQRRPSPMKDHGK